MTKLFSGGWLYFFYGICIALQCGSFGKLCAQQAYYVVRSNAADFQSAGCFSIAPQNDIFIIDRQEAMMYVYTSALKQKKRFGGKGWGNYEFDAPTDVSSSFLLDVFVTDYNNRRIQRFDSRLNHVQTIDENSLPSSIGRFYPRACAVSSLGDLFVIETDGKRILKFNTRSQLEREFGTYKDGLGALNDPKDIAISQTDEIFVLDGSSVIVYDNFGNYLRTIKLPERGWRSVQVSNELLIVTASRVIAVLPVDGSKQQAINHDMIIGISSAEDFVDAVISDKRLIVLTTSTIYFCSLQ